VGERERELQGGFVCACSFHPQPALRPLQCIFGIPRPFMFPLIHWAGCGAPHATAGAGVSGVNGEWLPTPVPSSEGPQVRGARSHEFICRILSMHCKLFVEGWIGGWRGGFCTQSELGCDATCVLGWKSAAQTSTHTVCACVRVCVCACVRVCVCACVRVCLPNSFVRQTARVCPSPPFTRVARCMYACYAPCSHRV
jgi:hypothetical protein